MPLSPILSQDLDDAPSTQGIQGRYATALFAASKKAGALDAVDKDLVQVRRREKRRRAPSLLSTCRGKMREERAEKDALHNRPPPLGQPALMSLGRHTPRAGG